jgi:hypothetical protein
MDRLEIYREKVKELLNKYSRIEPSYGEVAREQIFDTELSYLKIGLRYLRGVINKGRT